jgi:polyferredoxin
LFLPLTKNILTKVIEKDVFMNFKFKTVNWPRLSIQWGIVFFILLLIVFPQLLKKTTPDFEAYCPFGGLQATGSYFLNQALSCTMTSAQIVMGIILLAGVLLFSKLFCSFICPIGTLGEGLGKLGAGLKLRFTIQGIADKVLRSLKYILLFITVYFTLKTNELFCKKFDPYYAVASGFDTDVVVVYAVIAIVLVILGSVFIRLFWCKYLCPLGAISNIFKFSLFFMVTVGVYLILLQAGFGISYAWPLAVACAGGFIIEVLGQKSRFFPVAKITRNTDTCINCQLCTKKCPQGIDVAGLKRVQHVDCNLCGDCLLVCPEKNTLTISNTKGFKRLPVVAAIALVVMGITLGNVWEIPTIDERWAEPEEIETAAIFTQSGLKNIKCYGSSMAFANKMKQFDGIYGVATFVKHNRVKVYYNPEVFDESKIQQLLFTPQKKSVRPLTESVDTICEVTLKLEDFFDSFDFNYLSILLNQNTSAVGLVSEYDCPVVVKIYFPGEVKNKEELYRIIESETLTYKTTAGETKVDLHFSIAGTPEFKTIGREEYIPMLFTPYESTFNKRKIYTDDVIRSYIIPLGENKTLQNRFSYLVSHMSNDGGIVGFKTKLDSSCREVAEIIYIDTITNPENIKKILLSDSLSVTYTDGTVDKVKNMFDFSDIIQEQQEVNVISGK